MPPDQPSRNACRRRAATPSAPSSAACCATTASSATSCSVVRAEHFYADAHQKIFQAIIALYDDAASPSIWSRWPRT